MGIEFALVLHAHQPVGNFDEVIEQAYQHSYLPFIQAASGYAELRLNLHFSGHLLEWLAQRHPEYIEQLRDLASNRRIELLGGGYYEPILPAIRPSDRQAQIWRLAASLERLFGQRPRGFWLAERVWDAYLPATLAEAGVEYVVLDDTHFKLAGVAEHDLHGYYLTECQGHGLKVLPSSFFLRNSIPFMEEGATFEHLGRAAAQKPGSLITVGDDLEKFGCWPLTHQHVYEGGWLKRFLDGLDSRRGEIRTVRVEDHLAEHPPQGLVYLGSASYPEMMQWALPFEAAQRMERALADPATESYRDRLTGAPWMAFLARYREANLLHKTQLDISRRLQGWRERHEPTAAYEEAREQLLAGQCNDAYWHGWFGGLYAPHLRDALWSHLIAADVGLESLERTAPMRRLDLDFDGHDEIELRTPQLRALIAASDGGGLEALDFRPANASLINSLQRRPELYHETIRRQLASNPGNLPGVTVKGYGLEQWLQYDRLPNTGSRLLLLDAATGLGDYSEEAMAEASDGASGMYTIVGTADHEVTLSGAKGKILKKYKLIAHQLEVLLEVDKEWLGERRGAVAMVFNFLAPEAEDRRIGRRREHPISWTGVVAGEALSLWDGWRGIQIGLTAPGAEGWRVAPIYSVSQSEAGFERVYQGSRMVAVWPAGETELRITADVSAG